LKIAENIRQAKFGADLMVWRGNRSVYLPGTAHWLWMSRLPAAPVLFFMPMLRQPQAEFTASRCRRVALWQERPLSKAIFQANKIIMKSVCSAFAAIAICFVLSAATGRAQQGAKEAGPEVAAEQAQNPGWSGDTLRFLTDSDFPPFNYYDEEGTLIGFNVDLARALCAELSVECDIQARDWTLLLDALVKGDADAVIAAHAITAENLEKADLTNRYFQIPARFVARANSKMETVIPETLEGRAVAVQKDTAHEAFLKDFFQGAKIIALPTAGAARDALRTGQVELLFGDGVSLMFWINGASSEGCCVFKGGPYTEARYFGEGIAIAVKKGNWQLRNALNAALSKVRKGETFEELLFRYFPLRFY